VNWWSYYSFFIFTQRRKDAKIFFNGNTDYTDWTDLHGFFLTTNSLILYELIRFKFVHSWSYYSFFCLPRMHEFFFFVFIFIWNCFLYLCFYFWNKRCGFCSNNHHSNFNKIFICNVL